MSNTEMTFLEHLQEMRSRILNSLIAFIFFAIIGYYYSNLIISFLLNPINDTNVNLQALKITSIFSTKIIISFFFGVIFSFPVIVYQFLMFTLPALDNKFKTYKIILFIFMASSLFLFGLLFGYYILIPFSLNFINNISLPLNMISLNYTLENYLVYLIWILIISSLMYQLPIFIFFLTKIGFINLASLRSNRRFIIVIFFILAAILSPPDPISQLMIAIPLLLLYEFSILILKIFK